MAFKKEVTKTQFIESDLLNYYKSITQKPMLFVEAKLANLENGIFVLDMANMILLFVYERYLLNKCIDLTVLILPENPICNKGGVQIKYESFLKLNVNGYLADAYQILEINEDGKYSTLFDVDSCERPSVSVQQKKLIISGLSSVLRFLFKFSTLTRKRQPDFDEIDNIRMEMESLLGFRKGCLQACAEASVWTKFCEVDMTERMVSALLEATRARQSNSDCELPKDLLRFEYHLAQPVKIHNIRKRAQDKTKVDQFLGNQADTRQLSGSSITDSSGVSLNSCTIQIPAQTQSPSHLFHDFAEGPDITLSDIVLFPCVELVKRHFGVLMMSHLPKVDAWYHRVKVLLKETPLCIQLLDGNMPIGLPEAFNPKLFLPAVPQESLYQSDSARDKTKQFTKQADIEAAIHLITEAEIQPMSAGLEPEMATMRPPLFDWDSLPLLVHPEQGGQLPKKRRQRKCDQLANLVKMIQFVEEGRNSTSRDGNACGPVRSPLQIVDFCSGGGHVGILVAWLFPHSRVVLVENKEESVRRALARVDKLELNNISVFQCNLNSFDAHFDVGMALHACGTATDLVLQKCCRSKASFIVCPCCYGAIRGNHVLHYPRSSAFRESGLTVSQYFVIAHAADQTHDEENVKTAQGRLSMRIIDTDRLFYLQQHGYQTWLAKMIPESASPKNHILIGITK